jgi:hypothetical protein
MKHILRLRSGQALALVLAASCVILSAGCLRSTTVIDLRPDGGGTIVQEVGLTTQALEMLKGFGGANQQGDKPVEIFGEEQARKTAEGMGVTFVSGEPIKANGMEGYRAKFSFTDITKVKMNIEQGTSQLASPDAKPKEPPFSFAFDKKAASSLLTIQIADDAKGNPKLLPELPGGGMGGDAEKAQTAQALAMMKMMMAGLFVDVSMNVNGKILNSTMPYDGSHVTLMQIDFDKLMADSAAIERLQAAKDLKSLSNIPGLKILNASKTTIEFAR